ncbi:MAG: thioredoxin family protein [Cytophagales bacterium CG18_big_fil_WC_8_21_14_2_50_42_9]|nr:MAG: thioredoxin family protein [Cytophagales bacterium CG18_big_fil_WC_8_21_14_2_50_42_9]
MAFTYNQDFINNAFTYNTYRQHLDQELAQPAQDENAEKMRPHTQKNVALMDKFDQAYQVSDRLKATLQAAPPTIWLVLTEGWCGDAAFNVPMLAALEKAIPEKIKLRFLLRDRNLELMDAHLTDGGRSIPKLIILSEDLKELGSWGPRPAPLQTLMKNWKTEGLTLKELIPKVHAWYDADATQSVQAELTRLVQSYS